MPLVNFSVLNFILNYFQSIEVKKVSAKSIDKIIRIKVMLHKVKSISYYLQICRKYYKSIEKV